MDKKVLIVIPAHESPENRKLVAIQIDRIKRHTKEGTYEIDVEWNNAEGVTIPFNRGIKKAQKLGYDVVTMVDDILFEDFNWLPKFQRKAYENEDTAMVVPIIIRAIELDGLKVGLAGLSYIKISTFNQLGLYDENMIFFGHEVDYSIRIFKVGMNIVECPINLFYHGKAELTVVRAFTKEIVEKQKKYVKKYLTKKWGLKHYE